MLTSMKTPTSGPSGETIDTPRHRALGSASRVAILRLVRASDSGLTAGDVAAQTGLHFSTVRAHLDRLVEADLLLKARAGGGVPGRPAWRYRAVATPDPAPAPYRALTAALLDHLAAHGGVPGALQAGEAWGRRLAATVPPATDPAEAAVAVLRDLGFGPRRVGGDEFEVHLHTCPFLELVSRHPDVMCALHAGMIRGVLRAAGGAGAQATLEPFAAPTACVARLRVPTRDRP
jgi:predicted ArsR family transcriptional regulator